MESTDSHNTFPFLAPGAGEVIPGWDAGISGYHLYSKPQVSSFQNDLFQIYLYYVPCRYACWFQKESDHTSGSGVSALFPSIFDFTGACHNM